VFLDFDGTLAEIVARPELARLVPGGREILDELLRRVDVVAIISGRPVEAVRERVPVPGLTLVGLYGLPPDRGRDLILASMEEVERAATAVPGAWVEDKGVSLSVHYRAADDPSLARNVLIPVLSDVVARRGLSLLEGKMVIEVAAGEVPGKGAVVRSLARDHPLDGYLYAGDDRPDLDAFAALDELALAGACTVKVAVRSEETPDALLTAADVVVDGPEGLLRLLSGI
jgi:trehalose 6-phosphate phosphatase